ncbi:MAG: hypothetical protein QM817_36725 [Archangium sp.]
MRRGLLVVAVLVVVLIAGFVLATVRNNHQLGDRLATDLETLRARRIKLLRPDGAPPPRNTNGFACLAGVMKTAPTNVTALNDPKLELTPVMRGEKPVSELDAGVVATVESLRPWVEAMRTCSDASELQWVEAMEPWESGPTPWISVMRQSAIDARLLLADRQPEHALAVCTEGLEYSLDLSRVGLLGAMLSTAGLRMLAPVCSEAWAASSKESHDSLGPRWVLLGTRLASDEEMLEVERVTMELSLFRQFATDEARAKYPATRDAFQFTFVERLALARLWGRWDAAMRDLAVAKDAAAREKADLPLRENPWWLPRDALLGGSNEGYTKFLTRLESSRALLNVLSSLATGAKTPLPPGATEKDGVIELPMDDGTLVRLKR